MFSVQVVSQAAPEVVWPLVAEPARWSRWAPHLRGAVGLGSPEVELGRRGFVLVGYLAPVPVHVSAKDPGVSWEWTAGPLRFRHAVEPRPVGSLVTLELHAPPGLEPMIAAAYGPIMRLVARRLARLAAG